MSQRLLILRMTNQGVFFNRKEKLDWSATNFPLTELRFREDQPVYWLVNQLDYTYQSGRLRVEVLEYELEADEIADFKGQTTEKNLRRLEFLPLDREQLGEQLLDYDPATLDPILERVPCDTTLDLWFDEEAFALSTREGAVAATGTWRRAG